MSADYVLGVSPRLLTFLGNDKWPVLSDVLNEVFKERTSAKPIIIHRVMIQKGGSSLDLTAAVSVTNRNVLVGFSSDFTEGEKEFAAVLIGDFTAPW